MILISGVVKQTPRYPPPHPPPQPPQRNSSQAPPSDKIRKYSEEINRKKAEEEFLRSSLRGSKKLQQLEQKQSQLDFEAVVNNAFEADDDDDLEANKGMLYLTNNLKLISFFFQFESSLTIA